MRHPSTPSRDRLRGMQFRHKAVVRALQRAGGRLSARALEAACGVRPAQRAMFTEYLNSLVRRGLLEFQHGYSLPRAAAAGPATARVQPPPPHLEGTFIVSPDGLAHLWTAGHASPLPLPARLLHDLLPGDCVRADLEGTRIARLHLTHRENAEVIGVTATVRRRVHVVVDGGHPATRLHLERRSPQPGAGQVVRVRVTRYPGMRVRRPHAAMRGERGLWGVVDEVLGAAGDPAVEVHRALARAGLRVELPRAAADAARLLPRARAADLEGRADLRDCASQADPGGEWLVHLLEPQSEDEIRVAVSFADVAHFVAPGSATDAAASLRGMALPSAPLLPDRIARDLARLDTGGPRLAITVEMGVAADGSLSSRRVYESVVRADAGEVDVSLMAELGRRLSPTVDTPSALLAAANRAVASWLREHDVPGLYRVPATADDPPQWTSRPQEHVAFHHPLTHYASILVHQALKAAFSGAPPPRTLEQLEEAAVRLDLLEWHASRLVPRDCVDAQPLRSAGS